MADFPTLALLEQLLEEAGEFAARGEHQAVANAMAEAVRLCQTARTVEAATRLQLQAAMTSIRMGRADDAVAFIERAAGLGMRRS